MNEPEHDHLPCGCVMRGTEWLSFCPDHVHPGPMEELDSVQLDEAIAAVSRKVRRGNA